VQRQPGVAIDDGLDFIGQVDGYLTTLDQKTGKVVWKVQEIPWQKGGHLASAPLYYNGIGQRGHERRRPGQHQQPRGTGGARGRL
jgi:hypothetical protein